MIILGMVNSDLYKVVCPDLYKLFDTDLPQTQKLVDISKNEQRKCAVLSVRLNC